MNENKEKYYQDIREKILPLIKNGLNDLTLLSQKAEGAFPSEIINALSDFKIEINNSNRLFVPHEVTFPEPNPIDYEWRFTKKTSENISNIIKNKELTIGCFGVPTVFQALILEKRKYIFLFDINPFFNSLIKGNYKKNIIYCDLNNKLIKEYNFDIIIMDPPWYKDYYLNWIKQAINNLKENGTLYITKIPNLVRPNAKEEWLYIKKFFDKNLIFKETSLEITYETPFFELETLNTLNISTLGNWRTSVLVECILKVKKNYIPDKFPIRNWKRFMFGNKVVSLLLKNDDYRKIKIRSPYKNGEYTLKTVSNRDEDRKNVNFITSRNKVLIIEGTIKVYQFLVNLNNSYSFQSSLSNNLTNDEINQLKIIYSLIGV